MASKRRRSTGGFSLIELLLVLVILSILGGVVAMKFTGRTEQARVTAAKTQIGTFKTALNAFEIDSGRLPTSDEGLGALVERPGNVKEWRGPYLEQGVPVDPWGNPYVYRNPGSHNPTGYDVYSCGPSGRDGADDSVGNW